MHGAVGMLRMTREGEGTQVVDTLERVDSAQMVEVRDDRTLVLPKEVAETLGDFSAEDILLLKTEQGILVTTRAKLFNWALDGIGAALRESGVTLDELMESGAEIRQELYDERYGNRSKA